MKKILIIALLLILSTSFVSATSFIAGVSLGGGMVWVTTEPDSNSDARFGFSAGLYGNIPFSSDKSSVNVSVQPGVYYTLKGLQGEGFGIDGLVNLGYIEIPVLAKLQLQKDASFSPYVLAGPVFGINVVSNWIATAGDFTVEGDVDVNEYDFGLIFGVGANLEENISIDARINLGLMDITADEDDEVFNRAVTLMVSYDFM